MTSVLMVATAEALAATKTPIDARRNNLTSAVHGDCTSWFVLLCIAVGYTMDVMYFAWLPNSVEIDKAIQLPQFRLRRTVQYDCSQNYTGGGSHLSGEVTQAGLASMRGM